MPSDALSAGVRSPPSSCAFAISADALWAAAALFGKPFVLVSEALLEPTPVAYWLMAAVAVVPVLAVSLIFSRRSRGWLLFALGVVAAILVGADSIYYRFFGDVLSVPALFAVRPDAARGRDDSQPLHPAPGLAVHRPAIRGVAHRAASRHVGVRSPAAAASVVAGAGRGRRVRRGWIRPVRAGGAGGVAARSDVSQPHGDGAAGPLRLSRV